MPGSVAENLTLFADASRADLDAAASITGFDEVLAGLSDGYDTMLGAGGVGLSAGQRQRLALTRVLVSTGSLLLLDEPTAHLDPTSAERLLIRLRERAVGGDAVVVVAHGAEVLRHADEIVEMPEAVDANSFDADPLVRALRFLGLSRRPLVWSLLLGVGGRCRRSAWRRCRHG